MIKQRLPRALVERDEHSEQAVVIQWRNLNVGRVPALRWLHAIPNGGHRHVSVAKRMKAEGVTPGVSDLCWPYPRGRYHGLYIEMKVPGGAVSKEQREFVAFISAQRYYAVFCWSADEAINMIEEYLKFGEPSC